MASRIIPEKLIEEVRKHPVIFDLSLEKYRHSEYKDLIWKDIAKELNVEGQEEECKKRWSSIRDSLRRSRQKRKTKSGQAATSIAKYRYEYILDFLIPHLAERKGLSNVPDEENDGDETGDKLQQDSIEDTQQLSDVSTADDPEKMTESSPLLEATTPVIEVSAEKSPSYAGRKRKLPDSNVKGTESPFSQLMAFILAEKQAEKRTELQKRNNPAIDTFLAEIGVSLNTLDPVNLLAAKAKIFSVVNEFELKQCQENLQQGNAPYMYPSTSSSERNLSFPPSSPQITLTEEDRHFPSHENENMSSQEL